VDAEAIRGREHRQPSVGDLGGEPDVLRSLRAQVDGEVRAEGMNGELQGLAEPRAARIRERVVIAVVRDRPLALEHVADDPYVLAGALERLGEGLPIPPLDHLRSRDAEPEDEPAAGEVVD